MLATSWKMPNQFGIVLAAFKTECDVECFASLSFEIVPDNLVAPNRHSGPEAHTIWLIAIAAEDHPVLMTTFTINLEKPFFPITCPNQIAGAGTKL